MRNKTALITGAAKRIGAEISRMLHAEGMNIAIHYRSSEDEAQALCNELNALRADSAIILQADLLHTTELESLAKQAAEYWGDLSALINNASSFYPTPVGTITEAQLQFLIDQLEEESTRDRDYYISPATLDMFQAAGADQELLDILRQGLGTREGMEIVWSRQSSS